MSLCHLGHRKSAHKQETKPLLLCPTEQTFSQLKYIGKRKSAAAINVCQGRKQMCQCVRD